MDGRRGLAAVEAAVEALLPVNEEMERRWAVLIAFWGRPAAQRFLDQEGSSLGFDALLDFIRTLLQQAADNGELPADRGVIDEAERILALVAGVGVIAGGFQQERERTRQRARRMLTQLIADLRR